MDHASRFIQLYADLNDFMAAGPPPPLDRVTSAALQTMAPMAASLLLNDKRAQQDSVKQAAVRPIEVMMEAAGLGTPMSAKLAATDAKLAAKK